MDSKENIIKIVQTIASKVENLVERTIGKRLPITYLTIFSKTPYEYGKLVEWASDLGEKLDTNNGIQFVLKESIETAGGRITRIRIRKPDVYRSQIGCADLEANFKTFKENELPKHPDNMRVPSHLTYEMIEFFDYEPNDVLAYIVSK